MVDTKRKLAYFPGCSLSTSAKENNNSLIHFFKCVGISLIELEDWNCCGSSSAHSTNSNLAEQLPARNLSLVPAGQSLMVACPSCYLRLKHCQMEIQKDSRLLQKYKKQFGRDINPDLNILHFFEVIDQLNLKENARFSISSLNGLRCAPYYGCMLARPPEMRHEKNHYGIMEGILRNLGAEPVRWSYASRCCGTFLSVVRPDIATKLVNQIISNSVLCKADCIVTACAMCHMNIEMRCNLPHPIPVMHFSELLSLAIGEAPKNGWFDRHLIDPLPLLKRKKIL